MVLFEVMLDDAEDEECRVAPMAPPVTAAAIINAKIIPNATQKRCLRTPPIFRILCSGGNPATTSIASTDVFSLFKPVVEPGECGKVCGLFVPAACFS